MKAAGTPPCTRASADRLSIRRDANCATKNSCRTQAGRRSAHGHCAKRSGNTCKRNEGRNERTSSVLVSYRPEAGAPRRQCRSQIPPCALTFPSSAVATPNPYPARFAKPLRENSARRGPTMLREDEKRDGNGWRWRCSEDFCEVERE